MNNFEAEQLFHRVARFSAPRRNVPSRETPTVQWRPRYEATSPVPDHAYPRNGEGMGRGSVVAMSLRKIFA